MRWPAESATALGCPLRPRRSKQRSLRNEPSWPNLWGLLPSNKGLSDRIHLDETSVVAGSKTNGTLTVVNRGERAIGLSYRGCRPSYRVALTDREGLFGDAFQLPCPRRPLVIEPGPNSFPVVVSTTYDSCVPAGPVAPDQPGCTGGSRAMVPPLPPGRYLAVLVGVNLALPPAPPVPVTLKTS